MRTSKFTVQQIRGALRPAEGGVAVAVTRSRVVPREARGDRVIDTRPGPAWARPSRECVGISRG